RPPSSVAWKDDSGPSRRASWRISWSSARIPSMTSPISGRSSWCSRPGTWCIRKGAEMQSYRELYERGMERIRAVDGVGLLDLGAETKSQNRLNREYLDSLTLEMRLMDSAFASTATSLFGHQVPHPIQCAAVCDGRLL